MTYYFVNLLKDNPGISYGDLIRLIRNAIGTSRNQTPQVEGAIDRTIFGTRQSAGLRALSLKCRGTGAATVCTQKPAKAADAAVRRIEIDAGNIVGAKEGGPIAIYAANATQLTGEEISSLLGRSNSGGFTSKRKYAKDPAKDATAMLKLFCSSLFGFENEAAIDTTGGE